MDVRLVPGALVDTRETYEEFSDVRERLAKLETQIATVQASMSHVAAKIDLITADYNKGRGILIGVMSIGTGVGVIIGWVVHWLWGR